MGILTQNMIKVLTKNCSVCNKEFNKPYTCGMPEWGRRKNCSRDCSNKYWLGKPNARKKQGCKNSVPAWNKGILSPFVGELSASWKGEDVGYSGVHKWVAKWKGKPKLCEKCGRDDLKVHNYHWANIDHKYRRVLDDYIRLCVQCHTDYDKENNLK